MSRDIDLKRKPIKEIQEEIEDDLREVGIKFKKIKRKYHTKIIIDDMELEKHIDIFDKCEHISAIKYDIFTGLQWYTLNKQRNLFYEISFYHEVNWSIPVDEREFVNYTYQRKKN